MRAHRSSAASSASTASTSRAPSSLSAYMTISPARRECTSALASEEAQVVGGEVLGALRDPGEIADTELLGLAERAGEHQACGICERASAAGGAFGVARAEAARAQPLGDLEVETETLAAVARHKFVLTSVEMLSSILTLGSGLSWSDELAGAPGTDAAGGVHPPGDSLPRTLWVRVRLPERPADAGARALARGNPCSAGAGRGLVARCAHRARVGDALDRANGAGACSFAGTAPALPPVTAA